MLKRVTPEQFSEVGHWGSQVIDEKKIKIYILGLSSIYSLIALIGDIQPYDGDPFSNLNDVKDYCRELSTGGLQLESDTGNPYTQ